MPSNPKPVLELKFEPGEYLCTWHIPGLNDNTVHLAGSLTLQPDLPPRGKAYGDVPVESTGVESAFRTAYPQYRDYSMIKFTLANGGVGHLRDVQLTLTPGESRINGAAAVIGRSVGTWLGQNEYDKAAQEDETIRLRSAEIQVGGLDSLLGFAPLGEKTTPTKPDENGKLKWSAETNPESKVKWETCSGVLTASYRIKVNAFDFYNVHIRFSPFVQVEVSEPCELDELIRDWIDPIRNIASIATGVSQPVTYLTVRPFDWSHEQSPAQVYGSGLAQAPFDSNGDRVKQDASVVRCVDDGVDLLQLIGEWRRLEEEHHPLIETYAGMLHVKDSHPRSRYLLLLQSLEGMHGHETQAKYEERCSKHTAKRIEILNNVEDTLPPSQFKFLKNALIKYPQRGLAQALNSVFKLTPEFDVAKKEIEGSRLVKSLMDREAQNPFDALRIARNGLAHGTHGFPAEDLNQVNEILDRVVRAHALKLLGCPESVLNRLAETS